MKIKKHQAGGIVYTPFIPNQKEGSVNTTSTSSSSEKITGTLKKEIVDLLKENGIPNDVDEFLSNANSFLSRSSSLSNMSIFGGTDDDYDINDLVQIESMANKVKFNKQLYDSATSNLGKENAWSEIAVDDSGRMYVYNEDGLTSVNPSEYYKNKNKYQAITNSQLMGLREQQRGLSFNRSILNNVQNAVGMKSIVEYVRGIIKDFGTNTTSGYIQKNAKNILNGFDLLVNDGPDGYYKAKSVDQLKDVNTALSYLYNALPQNMKNLITAKTAAENGDPNSNDRLKLLELALTENTNREESVDYDSTATKAAGTNGTTSTSSEQLTNDTLGERYVTGNGLPTIERIQITPEQSSAHLLVVGQQAGPIMFQNTERPMESTSLNEVYKNGAYIGGICDWQSVSFGDQLLNQFDLDKVMYNNMSPMYRVYLPYKTVSGKIVPDFDAQTQLSNIQKEISKSGITNDSDLIEIAKRYGLTYDPDTKLFSYPKERMKAFMSFGAYAEDGIVQFDKKSQYIYKLNSDEKNQVSQRYKNVIETHSEEGNEKKIGPSTHGWFGHMNNIYEGNIFIPIRDELIGTALYNNQYVPKSRYENTTAQSEVHKTLQQASSDQPIITNFNK